MKNNVIKRVVAEMRSYREKLVTGDYTECELLRGREFEKCGWSALYEVCFLWDGRRHRLHYKLWKPLSFKSDLRRAKENGLSDKAFGSTGVSCVPEMCGKLKGERI